MSLHITKDEIEFEKRKIQAQELGIKISETTDIAYLELEISKKLELGMKNIKNILDEIDSVS